MAKVQVFDDWKIVSFGGDRSIFSAEAVMNQKASKNLLTSYGAKVSDLDALVAEAQRITSRAMARRAKATMSGWLTARGKHSVGIGWRGRAARDLIVSDQQVQGQNGVVYEVREKGKVLPVIRKGLKPGEDGPHVSNEDFEKWVKNHKLKYSGRKKKRTPKDTAIRVKMAVRKEGMSEHWESLPAVRARYFNYPKRFQDDYAPQIAESLMRDVYADKEGVGFRAAALSIVMGAASSAWGKSKIFTTERFLGQSGSRSGLWNRLMQSVEKDVVLKTTAEEQEYLSRY